MEKIKPPLIEQFGRRVENSSKYGSISNSWFFYFLVSELKKILNLQNKKFKNRENEEHQFLAIHEKQYQLQNQSLQTTEEFKLPRNKAW